MPEAPWYMTESVAACIEHVRPRVAEYVERMQRMPRSHPRWAAGALAFILVFSCYCIPNLIGWYSAPDSPALREYSLHYTLPSYCSPC